MGGNIKIGEDKMCSLDVIPEDLREDVIRELSLEPGFMDNGEDRLTIFVPKERNNKKNEGEKLTPKDSMLGSLLQQKMTPIQQAVARGVIGGKGWNEIAHELSDSMTKVHPDDVGLAHRCVCDLVRSVVAC